MQSGLGRRDKWILIFETNNPTKTPEKEQYIRYQKITPGFESGETISLAETLNSL